MTGSTPGLEIDSRGAAALWFRIVITLKFDPCGSAVSENEEAVEVGVTSPFRRDFPNQVDGRIFPRREQTPRRRD